MIVMKCKNNLCSVLKIYLDLISIISLCLWYTRHTGGVNAIDVGDTLYSMDEIGIDGGWYVYFFLISPYT